MNASLPRVALRADASVESGLGHVRRCAALACALRDIGSQVVLVTRDFGLGRAVAAALPLVEQRLLRPVVAGSPVQDRVPLAAWAGVDWQQDVADTVQSLRDWQPDWVVVDHYSFDARWHAHVAAELSAKLAAIDDLADRDLQCELLIDHNLHDDHCLKYAGRLPSGSAVLGGPHYALLGPAYVQQAPHAVRSSVSSIGIFMGGVDAAGLSAVALRACRRELVYRGRVEIAATTAYPHLRTLVELTRTWPDTQVLIDAPNLAEFFARHDLQIGAGGGAMWERCCMGAPTLALLAASNQHAVVPALVRLGAAAAPDPVTATDESSIALAVRSLLDDEDRRRALSTRSRALVDGLGARRVALRMLRSSLGVRPATRADAEKMHAWRNHPSTRQVSRNAAEIPWSDHLHWVQQVLADPQRSLLIAHVGAMDVGVIRFDRLEQDESEVSLYLDPALHGLGLGSAMLLAGERYEVARDSGVRNVVASVLPGNAVSERLFVSCGYGYCRGAWRKDVRSISLQ